MKILFTSDLHGDLAGFRSYAQLLKGNEYDLGVIAGDMTDYNLTLAEIGKTPGVKKDDTPRRAI